MEKHLKFYYQCLETGKLPMKYSTGLCGAATEKLINEEKLNVFKPTDEDEQELTTEQLSVGWWASGINNAKLVGQCHESIEQKEMGCTSLRQTIVAFMAVIKMEDFL